MAGPLAAAGNQLTVADAPPAEEGPISLQNHTSDAWFRNLKVRRIE